MKEKLQIRLKGGLLLGGGGSRELHDATLRDADGEPFLPASALKGAIREQLARLCGEEERDKLAAIFGAEGHAERFGGGNTGVYLSDGRLVDVQLAARYRKGYGYALRTQASIDRRTRRPAHQRLFQREVLTAAAGGLLFEAEVDASRLGSEERRYFRAAVSAVFALGAGRTSGLGAVEMSLVPAPDESDSNTQPARIPDAEEADLVLEAVDPLCLGADRFAGNFHTTLESIPASTLRGAIITAALVRQGVTEDLSGDAEFRRLFLDPESCVRFSDAVAVPPAVEVLPGLRPLTLRACKAYPAEHGAGDLLVRSYVQWRLASHGVARVADGRCPVCAADSQRDQPSRTVTAPRPPGAAVPERRVVTRLGLDPRTARAAEGKLFSLELLERGTRFVARFANLDTPARTYLRDAAAGGLRVGHGRGQGYGRVRVVAARAVTGTPLRERLCSFDDIVRRSLTAAGALCPELEPAPCGLFVAATLAGDLVAGDLVPAAAAASAEDAFLAALGLQGASLEYALVRAGQRGGFDTCKTGHKAYRPVVRAGSVLLIHLAESLGDELCERLSALERHGVGECREEGFGRVRFSDEVHQPGWRKA